MALAPNWRGCALPALAAAPPLPPSPTPADAGEQSPATLAAEVVGNILDAAGVNVTRTLRSAHDPETGGPVIDLAGEDSGLLIGRGEARPCRRCNFW